jgi:hypothetical protein
MAERFAAGTGKALKDRVTMLSAAAQKPLREHLRQVRSFK